MAISASDLPIPTPDLLRALIQRNFNSDRYINHLKTTFPNQVSYIDKTVHELKEAKLKAHKEGETKQEEESGLIADKDRVFAGDSKTSQERQTLDRTRGSTLKSAMSPKGASLESPPGSPFISINKDGSSPSPNPAGKNFHTGAGFRAALRRKQAETKQDAERRNSRGSSETVFVGGSELTEMKDLCKLLQEDKILTLKQLKEIEDQVLKLEKLKEKIRPSDIHDIEKDSKYTEFKDAIKIFIKTVSGEQEEGIKIFGEGIFAGGEDHFGAKKSSSTDTPKQTIETHEHEIVEKINHLIQFFTHAHIKVFIADLHNTLKARGVVFYTRSPATTPIPGEPWFRRKPQPPVTKTPKPQLGPAPEPESDTSHIRIHVENSAPSAPPFIPSAAIHLSDRPDLSRRGSNSSVTSFISIKSVTSSPSLMPKGAPPSPFGTLSISGDVVITSFFEQLFSTILEHKLSCPTNQSEINKLLELMKFKTLQSQDQSQAQASPQVPAKPDLMP